MKNKMRFIMPRLIGATVVVGVAALIIGILFKLMLGVVLLAGIVTLISNKVSRRREHYLAGYGQQEMPGFGRMNSFGNNNPWASKMQPINKAQKATTIVPIN
jgi:hypothetical protein